MKLTEFIAFCCDLLDIDMPDIRFGGDFHTATTTAYYDGYAIHLRRQCKDPADVYLCIAHELRHIWQLKNGSEFGGYCESSMTGISRYNAQPEDVDANAFAPVAISTVFGVAPKYREVLGDDIFGLVDRRARDIVRELDEGNG